MFSTDGSKQLKFYQQNTKTNVYGQEQKKIVISVYFGIIPVTPLDVGLCP